MAIQNLSLSEVRILQLAIIDARETGNGLSLDKPLNISALRYAKAFGVARQTAHEAILSAEKNLFDRRFSFLDIYLNKQQKCKARIQCVCMSYWFNGNQLKKHRYYSLIVSDSS